LSVHTRAGGTHGADFGARYPTAEDYLARFGAHDGAITAALAARCNATRISGEEDLDHTKASSMCNLYSITTNQEAILRLFRVVNRYVGNLAPMPGVFPDYPAPMISC